jgi:hypothetical protein
VVCRYEGRPATVITVHCFTHKVSLCMKAYESDAAEYMCPDQTKTCWQKYHDYYLPNGLFNSNGNIRRSSSLFKSLKRVRCESTDSQSSTDSQTSLGTELSEVTHVSSNSRISMDYSNSPQVFQGSVHATETSNVEEVYTVGMTVEF